MKYIYTYKVFEQKDALVQIGDYVITHDDIYTKYRDRI